MGLEMDKLGKKQKSPVNAWLPVLGLILAACAGVLAYAASPMAYEWLDGRSDRFPPPVLTPEQAQWITAGVLFVVFLMVAWALVAVFVPRPKSRITDKDLAQGRKDMYADKKRQKKRQRKMRRAALDEIRKNDGTTLK